MREKNSSELLYNMLHDFKEYGEVYQSDILKFIDKLKEEIVEELKENEPIVSVRVRDIFDAGSDCIDEVGINPWCLNEGGNENSYHSVKQSVAIRYGLV